jgi:hypothetical protein
MRADSLGNVLEQSIDSVADARPGPVHKRYERVTDGEVHPSLDGHSVSEMTLTMAPATAAATPLRKLSLAKMRDMKDGVLLLSLDMMLFSLGSVGRPYRTRDACGGGHGDAGQFESQDEQETSMGR